MLEDFGGKVAVITGAGSGFGREFARLGQRLGMRLVLADIQADALEETAAEMRAAGADVVAERIDVSVGSDVERLARRAREAFGRTDLLFNNAGVGSGGLIWENSERDWEWVLGVNLWGVIHGVRYFVPIMLEHGEPSHIVNTASMAGLTSGSSMAPYYVSKHGVVTLSECLHHEFQQTGADIRVSVLCPGWVDTRINESDRNRPSGAINVDKLDPMGRAFRERVSKALKVGLKPREVAELVVRAHTVIGRERS